MFNLKPHAPPPALDYPKIENTRSNTDLRRSSYAVDDIQFLYGQGTILDTISEKKSNGTLTTLARTVSLNDLTKMGHLGHRDSLPLVKHPRRKVSFSMTDVANINTSYHSALAAIEKKISTPPPMHHLIYAEPKIPITPPLQRPATPPGMPSWTEHQRQPRRIPTRSQSSSPFRVSNFLDFIHSRRSTTPEVGVVPDYRAMARYRPPRSAYGLMSQHPFVRASVAKASPSPSAPAVMETQTLAPRLAKIRVNTAAQTSRLPTFLHKKKSGLRAMIPEIRIEHATMSTTQSSAAGGIITPIRSRHDPSLDRSPHLGGREKRNPNNTPASEQRDSPVPNRNSFSAQRQQLANFPIPSPNLQFLPCSPSSPTPPCVHHRHAGFELKSPEYFSPLGQGDYILPPINSPWSPSTSRQPSPLMSGMPEFRVMDLGAEESPRANSVDARTWLMAGSGVGAVGDGDGERGERFGSPLATQMQESGGSVARERRRGIAMRDGDDADDGCWRCHLGDGIRRAGQWVKERICRFCCWCHIGDVEDDAEMGEEDVRFGTAEMVRRRRGSVVWSGVFPFSFPFTLLFCVVQWR
jgi:hypothetical protein